MPRYELSESTSNKFWEIKLSGASFTTTYGKIGTAGQTTLKDFKTEAEAKKEYDKLVAEKTKKGYGLVGDGGGAKPAAKGAAAKPEPAVAKVSPATPGARYFELVEGASSKFWEIKLDGESFTTRYGKIGTPGQSTEKDFDSARAARRAHDGLIEEKTAKGYVEQAAADAPVVHRNPELERAILADPYDQSAYMVYADWLQGQGDPRGELISLHLAAEAKPDAKLLKAANALIAGNPAYFLGPLEEHVKVHDDSNDDAFTWRFGYIHKAKLSHNHYMDEEFGGMIEDMLKTLLKHPSGQFVTELVFGFNNDPNEDSLDDVVEVLAEHAPPTLRALHLGDFEYPDQTEMSWYHVGKLGGLWKAVPNLTSLIVQGGEFELGTIALPALRRGEFRTGGMSTNSAKAIAKATWPRIEHLEVWYGDKNYGGTATLKDVVALLGRSDLTELRSLGIKNTAFSDELPGVLAASPLVAQLSELDLSMGVMTDEGARLLVTHKAAFQHLKVLDVSENYLSKFGVAVLKGVAKSVVTARQRDDRDPEYRHPSVGE
jgi:uncharacterized protein (TIGR02996 family)